MERVIEMTVMVLNRELPRNIMVVLIFESPADKMLAHLGEIHIPFILSPILTTNCMIAMEWRDHSSA